MAQRDFNDIYIELQERIYRLAAGITGSREDAEDVVQDLYERLWRRRIFITAQRNPNGYILTAARNLCLDRLRGRKPTTEVSPLMASESSGREEEEKDMGSIAARLIAELPEKQRTAMHLRDVECMEIEEIAQVMQVQETAVRMSLSRARTTVKEQLVKIMNHGI